MKKKPKKKRGKQPRKLYEEGKRNLALGYPAGKRLSGQSFPQISESCGMMGEDIIQCVTPTKGRIKTACRVMH